MMRREHDDEGETGCCHGRRQLSLRRWMGTEALSICARVRECVGGERGGGSVNVCHETKDV
jgi:hypothetical protein